MWRSELGELLGLRTQVSFEALVITPSSHKPISTREFLCIFRPNLASELSFQRWGSRCSLVCGWCITDGVSDAWCSWEVLQETHWDCHPFPQLGASHCWVHYLEIAHCEFPCELQNPQAVNLLSTTWFWFRVSASESCRVLLAKFQHVVPWLLLWESQQWCPGRV